MLFNYNKFSNKQLLINQRIKPDTIIRMETIIIFFTVLQSTAISLGMGASTLAIVNFFLAISDGTIDATERRMMGAVYVLLRISMALILATFIILLFVQYLQGTGVFINLAQITLISVLFINAFLMTKRIMPSKIGPALQASTWYTLGGLTAILPLALVSTSYATFLLGYGIVIILGLLIVNGVMKYLRK